MTAAQLWREKPPWHLLKKRGVVELVTQIHVGVKNQKPPYWYGIVNFSPEKKEMIVVGDYVKTGDAVVCEARVMEKESASSVIRYGVKAVKI